MFRFLMIGDVVGKPGRKAVGALLPELRRHHEINLVIANGENAAGGRGITLETANELLEAGVDVITSGNHVWDQREFAPHLDGELPVLRPLNYPQGTPGRGSLRWGDVMVVNLLGRVFMGHWDCPFHAMDNLLNSLERKPPIIVVDFHAEATSEKGAMGWYLDGRVSAVLGTHTHVATMDSRVLPKGTAYVTDVGMVGPINSVIGDQIQDVLDRFLSPMPTRLNVASGPVSFNAVQVDVDERTGKALSITRIQREIP
ncbi:MAG: TIGR00282 family metallophosphoesterase [Chloroflexi bacterium]|nr:TIGR00282 family metallophosphoesterase [Chloroflexota bacterium]